MQILMVVLKIPLNGLKSWFLDLFKNWSKEYSERHWTKLQRCFISRLEMKVKEIIKKLKGFKIRNRELLEERKKLQEI